MFKLEVVYPAERDTSGTVVREEKRFPYEERRSKNITEALEETFNFWNAETAEKFGAPHLAVGDVVKIVSPLTKYFICEAVGWTEVPSDYAEKWVKEMNLGIYRRLGLAVCIQSKLFPPIPLEDAT